MNKVFDRSARKTIYSIVSSSWMKCWRNLWKNFLEKFHEETLVEFAEEFVEKHLKYFVIILGEICVEISERINMEMAGRIAIKTFYE